MRTSKGASAEGLRDLVRRQESQVQRKAAWIFVVSAFVLLGYPQSYPAHHGQPLLTIWRVRQNLSMVSPLPALHFYCDESFSHSKARNLFIGGIAARADHVAGLIDRLDAVRKNYPPFAAEEVKWSKVGWALLPYYKEFVQVFFDAAEQDLVQFTSLCVDKTTFDHKTFNQNDPDVGFSKMIFQLLRHKVGVPYGAGHRIQVYLDKRTSKDDPNMLTPMLNNDLKRDGIMTEPFRRIEFKDSKACNILQLNDLLIGAFGSRFNYSPGGAQHKAELRDWIVRLGHQTCHPKSVYGWNATTFKVWQFKFKR